jgi:hypothetical protein
MAAPRRAVDPMTPPVMAFAGYIGVMPHAVHVGGAPSRIARVRLLIVAVTALAVAYLRRLSQAPSGVGADGRHEEHAPPPSTPLVCRSGLPGRPHRIVRPSRKTTGPENGAARVAAGDPTSPSSRKEGQP